MGVITAPITIAAAMSHAARSEAAVAKLSRVVKRSPQVLVKVTGRQKGAGHVAANFKYIAGKEGREGREDGLETDDGKKLRTTAEFKELAETWAEWDAASEFRRAPTTSISMVFSMPEGTNPDKLQDSVRAFAQKELEGRRWVMGMHTDTPRPHAHLTVSVAGDDGVRFNPRKADLQRYREEFARELRDRGIEADATPRKARGVVKKPERSPIHRMKQRARAERDVSKMPQVDRKDRDQIIDRLGRGEAVPLRPIDKVAVRRQQETKQALAAAARELARSPEDEHKRLAKGLVGFMRAMPRAETWAMGYARELTELQITAREVRRERERATPAGGPVDSMSPPAPAAIRPMPAKEPPKPIAREKPRDLEPER